MATASPGFEFDRWVGDFSSSDGYIAFVVMDTDKTLTAYFVPSGSCCSLVVNVAAPGSGTVTLSPPQPPDGYAVGDNVTLTPAAAPGYLFSHWEGGLAGSVNPALIAISGNQSIVAVFNPKVEVVRSPSGGGTVSLAPEQPADGYAAGTAVTATAVAADGYKFDHWSGDLSGSETQESITVEGLVTITAHFAKPREFPWRWVGVGIAGLLLAVLAIWYVRGELRKG
ncbi:MAG: hypothetical protein FJ020_05680 [Chloroflexi bacterium]|nr:hypothetical protein [Chloroflexota bacterium]